MSLVATPPLWGEVTPAVDSVDLPDRAEVLIVGAGLAGCATALLLAEAGWAPVVVEARGAPGAGISSRDTGLCMPVMNDTPHRLIAALGVESAIEVVRFAQQSLGLSRDQGLLDPSGVLMAAGIPQEVEQHQVDVEAIEKLGISHETWSPEEVAKRTDTAAFGPGIWVPEGGRIARDACRQLAARAQAAGARFVLDTQVTDLGGQGADPVVQTAHGAVAADVVILAAGAGIAQIEPWFEDKSYPVRTQLLATPPLDSPLPFPIRTQLGHAQLIPGPEKRMVASGCRWATAHLEAGEADDTVVSPAVHAKLSELVSRHRPDGAAPTHQWTAIMNFTCDGLPLLGPIPGRSRVISCAGFAGHQATLALGAARAVADGLLGESTIEVPELFELARFV